MKRLLAGALALFSALTFGATLNPIQLLNPAGSTSGQVIASTGATSAPSWTTVTPAGIGGLTAANNLSDVASATAALTNLGGLSTTTAASTYLTQANAASTYGAKASPLSQFAATTSAQLAGVLSDETGTGAAVFANGSAINPTSTGATTPGSGAFTSLASTNAKVFASNTSGQSLASGTAAVITGWTATTNVGSALVASTGVFTAPMTGNYLVTGQLYLGVPMALSSIFRATIIVNSVTLGIFDHVSQNATPSNHAVVFSAMVPATAGQQIVIDGFQNTGAAAALATGAALNVLSIMLVP